MRREHRLLGRIGGSRFGDGGLRENGVRDKAWQGDEWKYMMTVTAMEVKILARLND